MRTENEQANALHEIELTVAKGNGLGPTYDKFLQDEVTRLKAQLALYTTPHPEAEVEESLALVDRWRGESVSGLPAESALTAAIILGRALRQARARLGEIAGFAVRNCDPMDMTKDDRHFYESVINDAALPPAGEEKKG